MALTRRAGKLSKLRVVVVRFARARKRYERQGILVEEQALDEAEAQCMADEDARKARREREAGRRAQEDAEYVENFGKAIMARYPNCPPREAQAIARHAARKYSGRVGRTAAAKKFDPKAIDLAVIAHVRHQHTKYDELIAMEYDRLDARHEVRSKIDMILDKWMGQDG